ncbi:MAG: hypothetical protein OHK0053_21150 [Microscillaceae bacterium]
MMGSFSWAQELPPLDPTQIAKIQDALIGQFMQREAKPVLKFVSDQTVPLYYSESVGKGVIRIDEALPALIAKNFGTKQEKVWAFLLAHELVHHFFHHFQGESANPASVLGFEEQADREGIFVAHLAGYRFDDTLFAQILEVLYKHYAQGFNPENYPSQEQRVAQAGSLVRMIYEKRLDEVFHVGLFFYSLSEWRPARACLEFIYGQRYRNYLILNNLAATYLQESLKVLDFKKKLFHLPISFERKATLRDMEDFDVKEKMTQAADLLNEVIKINPYFEAAFLNLATLQLLEGRYQSIKETLLRYPGYQTQFSAEANSLLGLALLYQDKLEEAKPIFRQLADGGDRRGLFNWILLQKICPPGQTFLAALEALNQASYKKMENEILAELSPPSPSNNEPIPFPGKMPELEKEIALSKEPDIFLELPDSAEGDFRGLVRFLAEDMEFECLLWEQTTQTNLADANVRGLRLNDPVRKLVDYFGEPDNLSDNFYLYRKLQLVFEIDNGRVIGWTYYQYR